MLKLYAVLRCEKIKELYNWLSWTPFAQACFPFMLFAVLVGLVGLLGEIAVCLIVLQREVPKSKTEWKFSFPI